MNIRRLATVPSLVWIVIGFVMISPIVGLVGHLSDGLAQTMYLYVVQPSLAVAGAGLTYVLLGRPKSYARHRAEKALSIAAIIALWFVVYFLSGLILTYMKNSLVTGLLPVIINVVTFGMSAVALEYVRYSVMSTIARRLIVPLGLVVAITFAFVMMPINQITGVVTIEDWVKFLTSAAMPTVASSFLLTYLAVSAGLGSMLTYRLGMLAIALLPPIIPRYDWYLLGISSLLIAVMVYLVVDHMQQQQTTRITRHEKRIKRASDVMYLLVLISLVGFMTGIFSYRPIAIVSNSMQPVYSRGSMVIIQRADESIDIKVGDIVQYEVEGTTITHRVVAIDAASDGSGDRVYTTKGDNSPSRDPTISRQQIYGIVRAQVPYIGYPTIWLREAAL